MRSIIRQALAWFGLAVIAFCLIWLESLPRVERLIETVSPAAPRQIFPMVVLDPGHGGQDSGAMCAGVMEKDLTFDIAQRLDRRLKQAGIATLMTRGGDNYVSL